MKWYTVSQNNSGGYFIQNEDVNQYVSVEARTKEEAEDKLEEITSSYSEYCLCCGERWYWYSLEGFGAPQYYEASPLFSEEPSPYREEFVMHYADGRKFTCKIGEVPKHWEVEQ